MNRRWPAIILPALLLSACGEAVAPTPSAPPSSRATSTDRAPAGPPASAAPSSDLAAFERIELTDVRTGDHFNLGGFQGKQVIIEGMATW